MSAAPACHTRYETARLTSGFTLIELMVAVAIVGALLAIGAPGLREVMMNARVTGQVNDLLSALQLARSEAVKRNQRVYVCASNNESDCNATSWSDGWVVFVDENGDNAKNPAELPLRSRGPLEGNNTLASAGHTIVGGTPHIAYRPTGVIGTASIATAQFVLCDTRTTAQAGRAINVNITGRAQVVRVTCPLAPTPPTA